MRRSIALAATTALALAAMSSSALAVTKEEYKAQVEPICQTNSKANERILKGVRKMVKDGKLGPAGTKFIQAGRELKKTYNQLKAVPQPVEDAAKLAKWLGYVKTEADLFNRAGKKLKAGKKGAAQSDVNKLTTNANQANATVLAYNFRYCKFEPSKYT
ncbi:MAG: hypothetical protein ACREUF_17655 [Solimonas sp.]